jgi:hypothetical protein
MPMPSVEIVNEHSILDDGGMIICEMKLLTVLQVNIIPACHDWLKFGSMRTWPECFLFSKMY